MRIVVTGGDGFIGSNLRVHLREAGFADVVSIERNCGFAKLRAALSSAEFVFHLAGVNRPTEPSEFDTGNRAFTETVCELLRAAGRGSPLAYTSSTQVELDNHYGASKRAGELEVERYATDTGALTYVFRLTNVFGKWSRPNYNSAVATFCYNIARGLDLTVSNAASPLRLVYIDDVVREMVRLTQEPPMPAGVVHVAPVYETTVGEVVALLRTFATGRSAALAPPAGFGLTRALYATYLSFLPLDAFTYALTRHSDPRGVFAEVLKTPNCGQFSFFTAHVGITRGGHYHHTKSEKFLVLKGRARFGFRHVLTGETRELVVSGEESRVVETVPGWAHDVTNVGDDDMIVMLWANEIFDPGNPDTIASAVRS